MNAVLKQKALDYLGPECLTCGYSICIRALHFHHINSFEKEFDISSKSSWPEIRDELDKCVVLCANCHAEYHSGLIDPEYIMDLREG